MRYLFLLAFVLLPLLVCAEDKHYHIYTQPQPQMPEMKHGDISGALERRQIAKEREARIKLMESQTIDINEVRAEAIKVGMATGRCSSYIELHNITVSHGNTPDIDQYLERKAVDVHMDVPGLVKWCLEWLEI